MFSIFFWGSLLHLENFLSIIKISSKANSTVGVTSRSAGPVCVSGGRARLPAPSMAPSSSRGTCLASLALPSASWPRLISGADPALHRPQRPCVAWWVLQRHPGWLAHRFSRAPHSAWTTAFLEKSETRETKTNMAANGQTNILKSTLNSAALVAFSCMNNKIK